jgi:hypothetical protein
LRELAVFGRTAHPALAVEICADLGVRCAASQASSAAAWRCCLVAAPGSANPPTMSSRMNSARAGESVRLVRLLLFRRVRAAVGRAGSEVVERGRAPVRACRRC